MPPVLPAGYIDLSDTNEESLSISRTAAMLDRFGHDGHELD